VLDMRDHRLLAVAVRLRPGSISYSSSSSVILELKSALTIRAER
jgi:hypothetical protein